MPSVDTQLIIETIERGQNTTEDRLAEIQKAQEALRYDVDKIFEGFPNGDPSLHRRYHDGVLEWQETRTRLIQDILHKTTSAGFLGALGFLLYAVWTVVKMEWHK